MDLLLPIILFIGTEPFFCSSFSVFLLEVHSYFPVLLSTVSKMPDFKRKGPINCDGLRKKLFYAKTIMKNFTVYSFTQPRIVWASHCNQKNISV
jgi:hypothetical protein